MLVDADPQGSATRWAERRAELDAAVLPVDGTRAGWRRRIPEDAQRVIIDAPAGAMGGDLQPFLDIADAVVVPVPPSALDIEATVPFLNALGKHSRVRKGELPVGLVGNKLKPWTNASQQAMDVLGPVSYTHLDVYKRQTTSRSNWRRSSSSCSPAVPRPKVPVTIGRPCEWMARCSTPVSYTHLDVYKRQAMQWQSKMEYRKDTGLEQREQWVTTNWMSWKASESWRWAGRLNYSDTKDELNALAGAKFAEGNVGFAWRPWNSTKYALFGKYTYLYDVSSLPQVGDNVAYYDQRSQIASFEGVYHPRHSWEFAAKLARREGEVRMGRLAGQWVDSGTSFAAIQARYGIGNTDWNFLGEYLSLIHI